MTFEFYVWGFYGYFFSDFLESIDEDFEFLDIGDNQGLYSLLASKNPNCRRCHAFEPVEETASILRENIELNEISNIDVHEVAISDVEGASSIHIKASHSGAATMRDIGDETWSDVPVSIRCITHKELENIVGNEHRLIVKIDVEGLEESVLKQLAACSFFDKISDVYFEVDSNWVDLDTILNLLKDKGFQNFERSGENDLHYDMLARR
ncbi:MAG: FkbM family methyltransferase [Alphaproteobacteria bacterium]|jgi:FkbM family methyltransferase|nr:FkbM family methyltransferase [Alphaproteobacteria bacterium]